MLRSLWNFSLNDMISLVIQISHRKKPLPPLVAFTPLSPCPPPVPRSNFTLWRWKAMYYNSPFWQNFINICYHLKQHHEMPQAVHHLGTTFSSLLHSSKALWQVLTNHMCADICHFKFGSSWMASNMQGSRA